MEIPPAYTHLEGAARALIDARASDATPALLHLEIALLKLEQQRMLRDMEDYQRDTRALELANARLEQLNATQATQIYGLNDEIARLRLAHGTPAAPAPAAPVEALPVKPYGCDVCSASFEKPKGLAMHQRRAHGQQQTTSVAPIAAAESPAPLVARITLAAEDPHWRCAECGRAECAPFARAISDPDRCLHCVQLQSAGVHTNGLVAA